MFCEFVKSLAKLPISTGLMAIISRMITAPQTSRSGARWTSERVRRRGDFGGKAGDAHQMLGSLARFCSAVAWILSKAACAAAIFAASPLLRASASATAACISRTGSR